MKLSIVIVNMNHLNKLKNLFISLYGAGQPSCSHEIILIDNCSTDGSVEYIEALYPEAIIQRNTHIQGFATNNNQGVRLASGEYIFICNPDVIVLPGAVDSLLSYYEQRSEVGILCPQLLNSDMTHQASVRRFHNLQVLVSRAFSRTKDTSENPIVRRYLMLDFDRNQIQPIDWALGAAMLLHRTVYETLKGFDEKFFLYVEDVDLCLRCWQAGYEVVYYPDAICIHDHQKGSARGINRMVWYHLKSMVYFFYKHQLLWRPAERFEKYQQPELVKGVSKSKWLSKPLLHNAV